MQTANAQDIILNTHLQPPYQTLEGNTLQGTSVGLINCILDKMNMSATINVRPRKRNRRSLQEGVADGFFLSIPDNSLKSQATLSQPLILERWHIYSLRGKQLPLPAKNSLIGVLHGSNEESWLKQKGYSSAKSILNMSSLTEMLFRERVDYILVDQAALDTELKNSQFTVDELDAMFVQYVPLVAYFSNAFISKNKNFLRRFNRANVTCNTKIHYINMFEKFNAYIFAKKTFSPQVLNNIGLYIQDMKVTENTDKHAAKIDIDWKKSVLNNDRLPIINEILDNDLSVYLNDLSRESNYQLSEIFVFDRNGYILGMSHPTSDYYQGDEAPYRSLFHMNEETHISSISFDQSIQKFELQISMPIMHPETNTKIGGVTIGIDVQQVLSIWP
ncbi:MAG: transporter substrate-binding domain-containing protein [Sneathiella sp.]|nr:transporter substrate-binding domain-containing protein [Sneathiella sp.]